MHVDSLCLTPCRLEQFAVYPAYQQRKRAAGARVERPAPKFKVIPAGTAFFHIQETSTGRVRGFRKDHNQACALARSLELQIELLASDCLR